MNPFKRLCIKVYLWYCVYILKVDKKKQRYLGKQMWLAVNKDGQEVLLYSDAKPIRMPEGYWLPNDPDTIIENDMIYVYDSFIERNFGDKLTWEDGVFEY